MYILTSHNKPEKDQTPFTMLVMVAEDQVRFSGNQQICSKNSRSHISKFKLHSRNKWEMKKEFKFTEQLRLPITSASQRWARL